MLLLRLARGLNFADFADRTGHDAHETFSDVIANLSRTSLIHDDREVSGSPNAAGPSPTPSRPSSSRRTNNPHGLSAINPRGPHPVFPHELHPT